VEFAYPVSLQVGPYLISKHKLGEGGTSVVKLALNKHKKALVAVKIVAKYRLTDRGRDNLEREYAANNVFFKVKLCLGKFLRR
jgi:serine/threonine protein kinase